MNEKKDRELTVLGEQVVAMAEAQTAAIIKVEAVEGETDDEKAQSLVHAMLAAGLAEKL